MAKNFYLWWEINLKRTGLVDSKNKLKPKKKKENVNAVYLELILFCLTFEARLSKRFLHEGRRRYSASRIRSNSEATQRSLYINTKSVAINIEATAGTFLLSHKVGQVDADLDPVEEENDTLGRVSACERKNIIISALITGMYKTWRP